MTLIETDPPLAEPMTLAELKAHLRIDATDEDDLLEGLIRVARAHLETLTGTALMTQGFRLALDDWPRGDVIQLMKSPVQTIDTILVYDADGVAQEQSLTGALLDAEARYSAAGNPGQASTGTGDQRHRDRIHRGLWCGHGRAAGAQAGDPDACRASLRVSWRGDAGHATGGDSAGL